MREITQEQFNAAAEIFDLIDELRETLTKTRSIEGKLILKRRIAKLIADRRSILEVD
jgi:hypothetical protein